MNAVIKFTKKHLTSFGIKSIQLIGSVLIPLHDKWKLRWELHYQEVLREDDIVIVTYPKSGTTWMSNIMYQLLSDGNMNIRHIRWVVPFLEKLVDDGINPNELELNPRIFASHMKYGEIPHTKCKYIYVIRNGLDVVVSFYHHRKTTAGYNKDFESFLNEFLSSGRFDSWHKHANDWMKNQANLNVLYIRYEDLKDQLELELRRIIEFCGFDISEEKFARCLENSQFSFMKKNELVFDRNEFTLQVMSLSDRSGFIRRGENNQWKEYFDDQLKELFAKKELHRLTRNTLTSKYFMQP